MMKIKFFVIVITFVFALSSKAQLTDALNNTDATGKKQGHWIKRYENGNIQYDGYFKDDKPVGAFKRFYPDAQLNSLQVFNNDGSETDATFYHRNGFIASTGKYLNQKKEGKWKIYSANFDKYMICEEEYSADKRNGPSLKYYPNGSILERIYYLNDLRNGEWIQYYPDESIAIKSFYNKDKLEGPYEVFFSDGKPEFSGQYKNNVRDGLWHIYDEDGSLKYEITYNNGVVNNPEMFRTESDYLDTLEKNKGKIADPDISDVQ
jgi:antitoxin component YwqK of YwqJK toxin-antitoxin module